MTGVTGGLFEQVHEHPAEIHHRFVAGVVTRIIERRTRDDRIDAFPRCSVGADRGSDRVVRAGSSSKTLIDTGRRISETLAIRWVDVKLDADPPHFDLPTTKEPSTTIRTAHEASS